MTALTADIGKVFLMISVTSCDKDVSYFLWMDDIDKKFYLLSSGLWYYVINDVISGPNDDDGDIS